MKISNFRASDLEDKKKREYEVLEKCYTVLSKYSDVKTDTTDGEEPDFILTHPEGHTLGLEITEAHAGLVLRKLRKDPRYLGRLLVGDARESELACVQNVKAQVGISGQTAFGVIHKSATIKETREAITDSLRTKNSKPYSGSDHLGLVIMDCTETFYPADFLDGILPRRAAFFLSDDLGNELINSQFYLAFLVTPKLQINSFDAKEIEYDIIDLHQEFLIEKFRRIYASYLTNKVENAFAQTVDHMVNILKIGISVIDNDNLCLIYRNRLVSPRSEGGFYVRSLIAEDGYFDTVKILNSMRFDLPSEDIRLLEYEDIVNAHGLHLK